MVATTQGPTTKVTVNLPWPHKDLSPNARGHWAKKAKAKKKARHDAAACALEAGVRHISGNSLLVKVVFCPPDNRHRDLDNMLASLKAGLDGIADVVGIDDRFWALSMYRSDAVKGGVARVEIQPLPLSA